MKCDFLLRTKFLHLGIILFIWFGVLIVVKHANAVKEENAIGWI